MLGLAPFASSASAAPRVGVIVVAAPGYTEEQSDEIAYEFAGEIASQIEGDAIAGQSVRDALPLGVPAGCAEKPDCARGLAKDLNTDEVLLLTLAKGPRREIVVDAERVPRDPQRETSHAETRLPTTRRSEAKRARAVSDLVAALYPSGSVVPYVEPPPPPPPPVVEQPVERPLPVVPPKPEGPPAYKQKWFWPVVGVAGVLVVGGAVTGIVLGTRTHPSAPSITLP